MACVPGQGFQDGSTVNFVPDVLRSAFALNRPCIVTVQLDPLIEMHLAGLDPESLAIRRVRSRASTAEDSEYWAIDLGTETQLPNANRTTNWTISPFPQFNDAALIAGRLRELIGLCQLPTVSLSWTPSPSLPEETLRGKVAGTAEKGKGGATGKAVLVPPVATPSTKELGLGNGRRCAPTRFMSWARAKREKLEAELKAEGKRR